MKPFKRTLYYRSAIVGVLVLVALVSYELSMLVPKANAIPAFARKYNFACNVCHVPGFPKLNDFGNLFRDQGYQLGTDGDLPTSQGITMGFWPVSFRTTVGYQVANIRTDGQALATSGFGFTGLDLLSFGTLHRNIAFGLVYTPGLTSAGFGTGSGLEDNNIESGFVRLMNLERFLGGASNTYWLNLRVGKYELDVPFSEKRSPTLNTPFVMYHYVSGTVYQGGPISGLATSAGYANANAFGIGDNQPGLELSGIVKTDTTGGYFRYSLNMITSNGGSFSTDQGGIGRSAAFYGHVTQSFGGYGIVSGQRIGAFVVAGTAPTLCPSSIGGQSINANGGNCAQPGAATQGEPYTRVGADASITFDGQWNLFGAFMHAVDSSNLISSQNGGVNAGGGTNFQNAAWNGGFVELDWYPNTLPFFGSPGWLFTYRYDLIRNERQGDPTFAKSFNNVDSQTVMARYYIHQSARTDLALHLEYNYYRDKGVGANGGNLYGQTTLAGLDFAF
ncbi:peptidoglycan recognition protein family protein [Petrachloros mirabilis]